MNKKRYIMYTPFVFGFLVACIIIYFGILVSHRSTYVRGAKLDRHKIVQITIYGIPRPKGTLVVEVSDAETMRLLVVKKEVFFLKQVSENNLLLKDSKGSKVLAYLKLIDSKSGMYKVRLSGAFVKTVLSDKKRDKLGDIPEMYTVMYPAGR